MLLSVAEALAALHKAGWVHRDISGNFPHDFFGLSDQLHRSLSGRNILLEVRQGQHRCLLADFGLAVKVGQEEELPREDEEASGEGEERVRPGKENKPERPWRVTAPEAWTGPPDTPADIW